MVHIGDMPHIPLDEQQTTYTLLKYYVGPLTRLPYAAKTSPPLKFINQTYYYNMKCPHCLIDFHAVAGRTLLPEDSTGQWYVESYKCSNCLRQTLYLVNGDYNQYPHPHDGFGVNYGNVVSTTMFYPKANSRPVPSEVPKPIAEDYVEASLVLSDSLKASAALSRRCLQNLLLDAAGAKKGDDLSKQIQAVIDSGKLPSHIEHDIDAIRAIGNFAAHPNKDTNTGQILEVETDEAEWNLEVLESLFDYYYVQPAKAAARKAALNAKLSASGKPPVK